MRVVGIDPGLSGAAALICNNVGRRNNFPSVEFCDLPTHEVGDQKEIDVRELARVLHDWKPDATYVEKVHVIPVRAGARVGMGAVAGGKMMSAFGAVCAVCVLYTPVGSCFRVPPKVWKGRFDLLHKDKEAARTLMIDLFFEAAGPLKRKKDHNRAEAGLIAVYGAERQGMIDLRSGG